MSYENVYLFIYRADAGLMMRPTDEERFAEARRHPGAHDISQDDDHRRICWNICYPSDWEPDQAILLLDIQIKGMMLFRAGIPIEEVEGGEGGPERLKQQTLMS